MFRKNWKVVLVISILALGILAAAPFARNFAPNAGNKVVIGSSAFVPIENDFDYHYDGNYIRMDGPDSGVFTAPVYLPGSKTITQFNIYVTDQSDSDICVWLYLLDQANDTEQIMEQICSSGNQPGIQNLTSTSISPDSVTPSKGIFIWASIPGGQGFDLKFHGARVFYEN